MCNFCCLAFVAAVQYIHQSLSGACVGPQQTFHRSSFQCPIQTLWNFRRPSVAQGEQEGQFVMGWKAAAGDVLATEAEELVQMVAYPQVHTDMTVSPNWASYDLTHLAASTPFSRNCAHRRTPRDTFPPSAVALPSAPGVHPHLKISPIPTPIAHRRALLSS